MGAVRALGEGKYHHNHWPWRRYGGSVRTAEVAHVGHITLRSRRITTALRALTVHKVLTDFGNLRNLRAFTNPIVAAQTFWVGMALLAAWHSSTNMATGGGPSFLFLFFNLPPSLFTLQVLYVCIIDPGFVFLWDS